MSMENDRANGPDSIPPELLGTVAPERLTDQAKALKVYRQRVAQLILQYVQRDGESESSAYHQLMEVTGRGYSTIRNWLRYHLALPDLEAMAKIVDHWNIPAEKVFGAWKASPGGTAAKVPAGSLVLEDPDSHGALMLPLSTTGSGEERRIALRRYSSAPDHLILMAYDGADCPGVIENGEFMLVDTSCEAVGESGVYVLTWNSSSKLHTRIVHPLLGKPMAMITALSERLAPAAEEVPLNDGVLADGAVRVFGRVVGVLRRMHL